MIRNIRGQIGGFTIIEVIVVLTITVALLGSALALFSNRIPRTQFASAVNELSVKLDDTLSQVANGYYPASQDIECFAGASELSIAGGNEDKGRNEECLFIGQAIQFGKSPNSSNATCPTPPDDNCDTLVFYTIFGNRVDQTSGKVSESLKDSKPKVSATLAQDILTTGYGLHIYKILADTSMDANGPGGIAYLQTFGSGVNTGGDIDGASQVQLIPIYDTDIGQSSQQFKEAIDNAPAGKGLLSLPVGGGGIRLCLKSATTNQFAILTLGRNNSVYQSEKQIFESEPPECS